MKKSVVLKLTDLEASRINLALEEARAFETECLQAHTPRFGPQFDTPDLRRGRRQSLKLLGWFKKLQLKIHKARHEI